MYTAINNYCNSGIENGLFLLDMPSVEATEKQPLINKKELIKPTFLIIKAEKI